MSVRVSSQGSVATIQLDRPNKAHAYDEAVLLELQAAIRGLSASVVVVGSTGDRAFCGGADLDAMGQADPLSPLDLLSQRVFDELARHPAVSICAVQGAAIAGGCELALACDLRIVGPRVSFKLPETGLGIIPSAGGCTRATRLLGPSRAKAMILAGRSVTAVESVDWGLAVELAEDPWARALELAESLAQRDAVALRLAKQVIDGVDGLGAERIAEALLYHRRS
jgi:enoyl-CoA hydratase